MPEFETTTNNKRILIIEDDIAMAEIMGNSLKTRHFDVAMASDGADGINRFTNEKFDLILLDLLMPNIDGFQVMEELKKTTNPPPVIVLSSLTNIKDINKAKALGAADYFVKSSVTPELMVREISKILQVE